MDEIKASEKIKRYLLRICPALLPAERHKIENALKALGYGVSGGGTNTDLSECDISFYKK